MASQNYHRWLHTGSTLVAPKRLFLTGNGMTAEDRPYRAQESGLQEVLSSRPCWASRSVLSTHSSSALARLFPQSPPKLNEANSDTSRETTHAQSGSESSSQEAVPKKGRNSPAHTPGETTDSQLGTAIAIKHLRDWPKVPIRGSGWQCSADHDRAPQVSGRIRPTLLICPFFLGPHCCAESLAESAAAYTKATAWTCLLEKVEVITGEEAESNVLQVSKHGMLRHRALSGIKAACVTQ